MTKCLNSAGTVEIPAITSEMIETPMQHDDEGACLTANTAKKPDFYDVHLRPDDLAVHDTYGEWEDLSLEESYCEDHRTGKPISRHCRQLGESLSKNSPEAM